MEAFGKILSLQISKRLSQHFNRNIEGDLDMEHRPENRLDLPFLNENRLEDDLAISLAIMPHLHPEFLVKTINSFLKPGEDLNDICLTPGKNFTGLLPTGETLLFLLAGGDPVEKVKYHYLFSDDYWLIKQNIIQLDPSGPGEPLFSGRLSISEDFFYYFTTGEFQPPKLSPKFPAKKLETSMKWDDLVIQKETREQLTDLENWLSFSDKLKQHPDLGKRARKGYRTLFYGPPGTGKTLTASLLGKSTNRPVFRIDLSLLVSKYIGETEKNLAGVFKRAEHKNWILFFDEADALFSKRVDTESSNDRFANQEVAYLLQRIEDYNGMVILATNLKQNLDEAFLRRFQSLVHFPKPGKIERGQLWQRTVPDDLPLAAEIGLEQLVNNYELTASQISNIVQACFIDALAADQKEISRQNLMKNIRLEYGKENLLFEELI